MNNEVLAKIILIEALVIIFLGLPLVLISLFHFKGDEERIEIFRELSPNEQCELVIWRVGCPGPFGPDHLDFSLNSKRSSGNTPSHPTQFSAEISNDGSTGSYFIEWSNDYVQITLSGDEQKDAVYILPFP